MKYYKIDIKIYEEYMPPYFTGSQLRGALGYALKKVVCINPTYECENCFAKDNCLFYTFYLEDNYHKYRFDISLGNKSYDFSFYLFDEVCEQLPFILSSFHKLLTSIGLGKENKYFNEFKIYVNDILVYENETFDLKNITQKEYKESETKKDVAINILTPIRIKKENKLIYDDSLDLFDILLSSRKRYEYIYPNAPKLEVTKEYKVVNKNLYKKNLTRYSSPQKTKMKFDGVMGSLVVKDLSEQNYKILKIAELLNVGKQTVFGLGKIEVKEI
ncbi:MAG: CRISPR system precrRNA processing endoribonuclease RAMP protein Cas6 [Halarcobacter sp.]